MAVNNNSLGMGSSYNVLPSANKLAQMPAHYAQSLPARHPIMGKVTLILAQHLTVALTPLAMVTDIVAGVFETVICLVRTRDLGQTGDVFVKKVVACPIQEATTLVAHLALLVLSTPKVLMQGSPLFHIPLYALGFSILFSGMFNDKNADLLAKFQSFVGYLPNCLNHNKINTFPEGGRSFVSGSGYKAAQETNKEPASFEYLYQRYNINFQEMMFMNRFGISMDNFVFRLLVAYSWKQKTGITCYEIPTEFEGQDVITQAHLDELGLNLATLESTKTPKEVVKFLAQILIAQNFDSEYQRASESTEDVNWLEILDVKGLSAATNDGSVYDNFKKVVLEKKRAMELLRLGCDGLIDTAAKAKKAARTLSLAIHPDKNPGNSEEAEVLFKIIAPALITVEKAFEV
jgi:hypothetical protein